MKNEENYRQVHFEYIHCKRDEILMAGRKLKKTTKTLTGYIKFTVIYFSDVRISPINYEL